jgi:hypothetical protein
LSGVIVHRTTSLRPEDIVTKHDVLVTSPARTLLDIAGRLTTSLLERTLDEGVILRTWQIRDIQRCLARSAPNLPGRARLWDLLDLRAEDPLAESLLEARVYRALRSLPPYEPHFVLRTGGAVLVLDAAWPALRTGVEIIGRSHRLASRSAFDRERRKLNLLAAAHWQLVHLTATMSVGEMLAAVRALLPPDA